MSLNDGNDTSVNTNMEENVAEPPEAPRKITKTGTPKLRFPLKFKLQLITEVKKYDIIWQDIKEKKNPELSDDAWQRVCKAMRVKKELCIKLWKHLIHSYRSHLNRNTHMLGELSREMAFMAPQLKKSASDQSDSEPMEPESPLTKKQTAKPKKMAKRASISEEDSNEDQLASVAILKLLFANLPAEVMQPVRRSLVEVLVKLMPDVNAKISECAKQQVKMGADMNKIDWTALDIPVDICKAVWNHKVKQMVLDV